MWQCLYIACYCMWRNGYILKYFVFLDGIYHGKASLLTYRHHSLQLSSSMEHMSTDLSLVCGRIFMVVATSLLPRQ